MIFSSLATIRERLTSDLSNPNICIFVFRSRNLQKRHDEASQDLAAKARAASVSEQSLSGERASFDIERNALLSDIKSLTGQVEELRQQAAQQAAAGGDTERLQAEALASAQAQARELESEVGRLRQQLETAAEQKRSTEDTLQRMRELQGAKEEEVARLRAQLDDATQANDANAKHFEAKLAQTESELAASVQAKATLEEEQRAQFAQMQAREQKAAQECERMFKLVQQAHVKVQEKERDFKKQLDGERARFTTAMQTEVDRRMQGVQAKYEEEARQRRKLFNIVQELQGNIRCVARSRVDSSRISPRRSLQFPVNVCDTLPCVAAVVHHRVYTRVRPMLDAQEESIGMGIDFVVSSYCSYCLQYSRAGSLSSGVGCCQMLTQCCTYSNTGRPQRLADRESERQARTKEV